MTSLQLNKRWNGEAGAWNEQVDPGNGLEGGSPGIVSRISTRYFEMQLGTESAGGNGKDDQSRRRWAESSLSIAG